MTRKLYCVLISFFLATHLFSQDSTSINKSLEDVFSMSLDELMSVPIVSASRLEENSFDSPVSSYVITAKEIKLSGANSIPEALRLCPGVIVREISNGTYDVSIRGGVDGLPIYAYSNINYTTLVMIDNRPVYSSYQGGTYWQNLPVSLLEIDRIEVVLGPSSPLYGPNAVSGVINIITNKQYSLSNNRAAGNVNIGNNIRQITALADVAIQSKLTAEFLLDYEERKRFSNLLYDHKQNKYVSLDSFITPPYQHFSIYDRFPNSERSLYKINGAANLYYQPNNDVFIKIGSSFNENEGLLPISTGTPISKLSNKSNTQSIQASFYKFNFQFSYLSGKQGINGNQTSSFYDYSNTDIYLDKSINLFQNKLNIRPSIAYQSAYVNDKKYTIDEGFQGTFGNDGRINNLAGALKLDFVPFSKLRIIVSSRIDKQTYPQKALLSYQSIVNYKIKEKTNIRVLYGKSHNGSFMVPTLLYNVNEIGNNTSLILEGNTNLNLLKNRMFEIGCRTKMNAVILDIALFQQKFSDFNILVAQPLEITENNVNIVYKTENIDLIALQHGITLSLQSSFWGSKIQFRPQLTIQKTQLQNFTPYYQKTGEKNIYTTTDTISEMTPQVWGGFNFIYSPFQKVYFSLSCYYFSQHRLHLDSEKNFETQAITNHNVGIIREKVVLNSTITYEINKAFGLRLNGRNLLNQTTHEGFGSDQLGTTIMVDAFFNIN